jgi:CheY-like chemotaxis protein
MTGRPIKRVLIVDDDPVAHRDLCDKFREHNVAGDGVFQFEVDVQESIDAAIESIQRKTKHGQYDVIVLDLSFTEEGDDFIGLRLADALGLYTRLGQAIPVTIVFSAYASIRFAVAVMRCGVWDVLDKLDAESEVGPYQDVVDSAVSRLRSLDAEKALKLAAVRWTHQHIVELQSKFAGQVVAVWNVPDMRVVAHGKDAFELEKHLHTWREKRPDASHPYVVWIPSLPPPSDF